MTPPRQSPTVSRRIAAATIAIGVATATGTAPAIAATLNPDETATVDRGELSPLPATQPTDPVTVPTLPRPPAPTEEPTDTPTKKPSPPPTDEPTEPDEPTDPPKEDGYDPTNPGEHDTPDEGQPAPPDDIEHTYPEDNTDPVTVSPGTDDDAFKPKTLQLIDPATGKRTLVVVVADIGSFTTGGDGAITFSPFAPFEGPVT